MTNTAKAIARELVELDHEDRVTLADEYLDELADDIQTEAAAAREHLGRVFETKLNWDDCAAVAQAIEDLRNVLDSLQHLTK